MDNTDILLYTSEARITKCRDSSVSVGIRVRAGRSGFDSRQRFGISLYATASRPALGPAQPPIQWVPGILTPAVKRQGCEADH